MAMATKLMIEQDIIHIRPVILCGGSGERLWPLSRSGFPKQFLILSGKKSLFEQAVERANSIFFGGICVGDTLIVTGEEHRFLVLDQLRDMSMPVKAKILLEPEPRNTAPAVTLAALESVKNGDDPVLTILPADQIIQDLDAFADAMQRSIQVAATGSIVILGVKPTGPETGFGYIRQKGIAGKFGEFDVVEFVEKPDIETAQFYVASQEYKWNAGIFVVRASVWLNALKLFRKDIFDASRLAFKSSKEDRLFIRPDDHIFRLIPAESVDYAVIEKCPDSLFKTQMISLNARWSDLGSWDAVWQVGKKDSNENVIHGDVFLEESTKNLIHSSHRLVTALGVKDLVIVETADAVLVANRHHSQHVKKIVNQLSFEDREENVLHRKVSRPWGWYDTIDVGDQFKVKRIQVNPGASLSLQKHAKRAEHWVVVKGRAEVTCGEKKITLRENESTFIPLGEMHQLSNPSTKPLEIIEVQSGSYFGEDDIIRISDGYGRE
jgi:mannose-1-phosphate guanylyltransferase / mannose-6-phosphate isomerase